MKLNTYILLLTLLIISLFIILNPAVSYKLFPQKREALLSSFFSTLEKNQSLDPKKYWEFREFYTPGSFSVSKNYSFSHQNIPIALKSHYLLLSQRYSLQPYLIFTSGKIESFDALVKKDFDLREIPYEKKPLIDKKSLRITNEGTYYSLMALTKLSDMKRANGFFQDEGTTPPAVNSYYLTVAKIMKN